MTTLKADAEDRRRAVYAVLVLTVLALLGGYWLVQEVRAINALLAAGEPFAAAERLRWLKLSVAVAAALSAGGMALYLLHVAMKTLAEARFPPSGSRSLADFTVREGDVARWIGRALLGCALALTLLSIALTVHGVRRAVALTPPAASEMAYDVARERFRERQQGTPQPDAPAPDRLQSPPTEEEDVP